MLQSVKLSKVLFLKYLSYFLNTSGNRNYYCFYIPLNEIPCKILSESLKILVIKFPPDEICFCFEWNRSKFEKQLLLLKSLFRVVLAIRNSIFINNWPQRLKIYIHIFQKVLLFSVADLYASCFVTNNH